MFLKLSASLPSSNTISVCILCVVIPISISESESGSVDQFAVATSITVLEDSIVVWLYKLISGSVSSKISYVVYTTPIQSSYVKKLNLG